MRAAKGPAAAKCQVEAEPELVRSLRSEAQVGEEGIRTKLGGCRREWVDVGNLDSTDSGGGHCGQLALQLRSRYRRSEPPPPHHRCSAWRRLGKAGTKIVDSQGLLRKRFRATLRYSMTARPDELAPSAADLLGDRAYPESQVSYGGATYWLERSTDGAKRLMAVADDASAFRGFVGTVTRVGDEVRLVAEATPDNALALRAALPWLKPSRFGLHTSAGFGDRLGLATPGHVRALKTVDAAINPVFAQQSIREMGRCHRSPRNVLDDATWGAFQAGWAKPVGGDADHLEQPEDIDDTVAAGFVFYTLDPKAEVDPEAEYADPAAVRQKVEALDWTALESGLATFTKSYVEIGRAHV